MAFDFVQVALAAGFSGGNENSVNNWGQIEAKKAGLGDTDALLVTTFIQGLAISYGAETYGFVTVGDYSVFTTKLQADAFRVIAKKSLEASQAAAISAAIGFTNKRQLDALKFIVDNLLLSGSAAVTSAKLFDSNTRLLDLFQNQDPATASSKGPEAIIENVNYDTEEWEELVEQRTSQIRNGDDTKIFYPNVAVFGKDALSSGEGLTNLVTTAKSSIVTAVNEVATTANNAFNSAGDGLISTGTNVNIGAGTGITVNADDVALAATVAGEGLTHTAGVLDIVSANNAITVNADNIALTLAANSGLDLSAGLAIAAGAAGNGLDLTAGILNVGAGNGITVAADTVAVDFTGVSTGGAAPTSLAAFVGNTDIGSITLTAAIANLQTAGSTKFDTAGDGLTSAGTTVNVGAGTGITVNADDVALAATVAGAGLTHTAGVLDIVSANNAITVNADNIALTLAANSGLDLAGGLAIAAGAAGNGLDLTAGILNVGAGNGITVAADTVAVDFTGVSTGGAAPTSLAAFVGNTDIGSITLTAAIANLQTAGSTKFDTAGDGLTSAGTTVNVGAGTGITVNADDVALAATVAGEGLTHTSGVLDIVSANNAITVNADNIALTLAANSGLDLAGGLAIAAGAAGNGLDLTAGVLNVGAGTGITVNANDVALADTVAGAGLTHTTGVLDIVSANPAIVVNANDIALTLAANSGLDLTGGLAIAAGTAGNGLTLTSGVLTVGAGDDSIAVNADDIQVKIAQIDPDIGTGSSTLYAGGLEVRLNAGGGDETNPGLAVKTDGTTIGLNTNGELESLVLKSQIRNHLDSTTIPIDEALVGANPTTAGEGLSNLNADIKDRTHIVASINSLSTQKVPFLTAICGANSGISQDLASIFDKPLDNTCAGTSSTLSTTAFVNGNNLLRCMEYVSHIANGVSGTNTINAASVTECRTRFGCAVSDMDGGQLKTTLQNNLVLQGQLEAEVCAQYYL